MRNLFIIALVCTSLTWNASAVTITKLPTYKVNTTNITVSGISSGAFMATQLSTAFSKLFSGSASVAGGIYWCAQGASDRAQTECMNTTANIKPNVQIEHARQLAAQNEIDPLDNLARQRHYIFASPKDTIIKPPSSDKLYEFLTAFVPAENIKFEKEFKSAHGFPTLNFGSSCALGFSPWILKCNFDTAGEIFKQLYPEVTAPGTADAKNLFSFDQSEFGNAETPLFAIGWVYVPTVCQNGQECNLHVALHGCQMNPDFIQDQFAKNAGYNEWAEANHTIVLFPQSAKIAKANPYACWDWFGFTGPNYVTKQGPQMKAIKAMVDRLVGRTL